MLAESARDTAAKLHGRALPAGRAAEEVRGDRRSDDQRGHAERHPAARLVDLVDDEVVAALGRASDPGVGGPNRGARERQTEQQPWMAQPRLGDGVERPQKPSHEGAHDGCHGHGQAEPFAGSRAMAKALGDKGQQRRKRRTKAGDGTRTQDVLLLTQSQGRNHQLREERFDREVRQKSIAIRRTAKSAGDARQSHSGAARHAEATPP